MTWARSTILWCAALWTAIVCGSEARITEMWRLRFADGTGCSSSELPPPKVTERDGEQLREYRSPEVDVTLRITRRADGVTVYSPTVVSHRKAVEFMSAPHAVEFTVDQGESVFAAASFGIELRERFFHAPVAGDAPWKNSGPAASGEFPAVEAIPAEGDLYARHAKLRALIAADGNIRQIGQLTDFLAVEPLDSRHNHFAGTVHAADPAIEVTPLRSWNDFIGGLERCDMIVNYLPGGIPALSAADVAETATRIRRFLARGGRWVEFSGQPAFTAVFTPDPALPSFRFAYPERGEGFSDFVAVGKGTVTAFYGIQERNVPVFDPALPADRFACGAEVEITALGGGRARWSHLFRSFAAPGKPFRFPAVAVADFSGLGGAILEYGRANGISRSLAEKVPAGLLAKWTRSFLLKINDKRVPIRQWRELVESGAFATPVLFHHIEWVHDNGVFDQYYPDYFPYDPAIGDEAELSRFYQAVRQRGHLSMPYTQPIFWDLSPKRMDRRLLSEAVMREVGSETDVRTFLSGLQTRGASGEPHDIAGILFHVSPWSPAVRELDRRNYDKFVRELGCDLYFHDSIGAEPYRNDFSGHAPVPNAHFHGLLALAERERAFGAAPLVTDEGFDLAVNSYAMLCGGNALTMPTAWGIYRPYQQRYAKGCVRPFPFLHYLIHDKVLLTGHNSGNSLFSRDGLSAYAVNGLMFQSSMRLSALHADLRQPGGGWNRLLGKLQNLLGPLTAGKALVSVGYPEEDVLETVWEGGVRIVGNLRPEPYGEIAPYGFLAELSGRPVAGIVLKAGRTVWFAGDEILAPPAANAAFEPAK